MLIHNILIKVESSRPSLSTMRSSSLFLFLTFLLSIQLASGSILGTYKSWFGYGAKSTSPVCCRPTSITIEPTSLPDVLLATYKYSNTTFPKDEKCPLLFGNLANLTGTMTLVQQGHKDIYTAQKYYSNDTKYQTFYFQVVENGQLSVTSPGTAYDDQCEFSSTIHLPLYEKSSFPFAIVILVVSILGGVIGFVIYRRKQKSALLQESFGQLNQGVALALNSAPNSTYVPLDAHRVKA